MDALEEQQLKLAIEQSLASSSQSHLSSEGGKGRNEDVGDSSFSSQDLAFFTDYELPKGSSSSASSLKQHGKNQTTSKGSTTGTYAAPPTIAPEADGQYPTTSRDATRNRTRDSGDSNVFSSLYRRALEATSHIRSDAGPATSSSSSSPAEIVCQACKEPCSDWGYGIGCTTTQSGISYHNKCLICNSCKKSIQGQFITIPEIDLPFHRECFRCTGCNERLEGSYTCYDTPPQPYHPKCRMELFGPRCCLCNDALDGYYYTHHYFTSEKYCLSHEGRSSCFACGRKEPLPSSHREGFVDLLDGRSLCVECSSTLIVDSSEAEDLYKNIVAFMGRQLGLSIPKEMWDVPILVVDVQSLNENMNRPDGGVVGHHGSGGGGSLGAPLPPPRSSVASNSNSNSSNRSPVPVGTLPGSVVRGLTLSTCCDVRHIPRGGVSFNRLAGAVTTGNLTSLFQITQKRDVTAVLVLYGLPRDLIASILAHEAMHVWMKLNRNFPFQMDPKLEEGLCQVIAHLYLENISKNISPSFSSSSSNHGISGYAQGTINTSIRSNTTTGDLTVDAEATLRAYFAKQIETDASPIYGDGFREAHRAVQVLGLEVVLEYIQQSQCLPNV